MIKKLTFLKNVASIALIAMMCIPSIAHATPQCGEEFAENLDNCKPYSCTIERTKKKDVVTHIIEGLDKEGRCTHYQKFSSSNQQIACSYSKISREMMAKLHRMRGKSYDGQESDIERSRLIFQLECMPISAN